MQASRSFFLLLILVCFLATTLVLVGLDHFQMDSYFNHPVDNVTSVFEETCKCHKAIQTRPFEVKDVVSYCNPTSTLRGPNQKIISFSFYGRDVKRYFGGIDINAKDVPKYYPGYVYRLYMDTEANEGQLKDICGIVCSNKMVDLCPAQKIVTPWGDLLTNTSGSMWRFIPMIDPLVSEWHSRDLDSRIDTREASAVQEWREHSNLTFHVMRDHPYHNVPVMAGMFGMKKNPEYASKIAEIFELMMKGGAPDAPRGIDQNLLAQHFWPFAHEDAASYDSYQCLAYPKNHFPFPTQRLEGVDNNYVGSDGMNARITLEAFGECPETCRPKDHKDWLLC